MRAVAGMRCWQRIQFRHRQTGTRSTLSIYVDSVRCFASGASSTSATTLRVVRLQGGPGGQSSKYTSTWADLKKEAGVHGRDMIQLLQKSTLPQFAILPRKNSLLLVRAAAQTASDARPAPCNCAAVGENTRHHISRPLLFFGCGRAQCATGRRPCACC